MRFLSLFILILVGHSVSALAQGNGTSLDCKMSKFKYVEPEPERNEDRWKWSGPTDPNAAYTFVVRCGNEAENPSTNWDMNYTDVLKYREILLLEKYFNVGRIDDLVGKTVDHESYQAAVQISIPTIILKAKYGENYRPPTKEQIYQQAVEDIAQMKCPGNFADPTDVNYPAIYRPITQAFPVNVSEVAKIKWLEQLNADVQAASKGKVTLKSLINTNNTWVSDSGREYRATGDNGGNFVTTASDAHSNFKFYVTRYYDLPFICEGKKHL